MTPFPSTNAPVVRTDGRINPPWNSYLSQFTQQAAAAITVLVGASPYIFIVPEPGFIAIIGGTISDISFFRGAFGPLNLTGAIYVPVAKGDAVQFTYSVAPIIIFLPMFPAAVQ